jgi:hypothetical protein
MGRFKQLFKQPDTAAKLETCKQELHQAIGMFRVHLMALNPAASVIITEIYSGQSWGLSTISDGACEKRCKAAA